MSTITTLGTKIDSSPEASPKRADRKPVWLKRIVFLGTALAILLGIFGATTHRPVLLKQPEQIASKFDASVIEAARKVDREFQDAWSSHDHRPARPGRGF